jgi:hypothetical protein
MIQIITKNIMDYKNKINHLDMELFFKIIGQYAMDILQMDI